MNRGEELLEELRKVRYGREKQYKDSKLEMFLTACLVTLTLETIFLILAYYMYS